MTFEFIDNVSITNSNIWSYVTLRGAKLMLEKEGQKEIADKKRSLIEQVVKASKGSSRELDRIATYLNEVEDALVGLGFNVREVKMKLASRGLFGIGSSFGTVAFEVGLCFDPIFNVPFIPGSSLKGAVRAAYYKICKEVHKMNENECEKECWRLFGGTDVGVGLVGFTDAYPIQAGEKDYLLYPDVMTPHYTEGIKTELDVSPTPIIYITVAPGTRFQFHVFWRRRSEREVKADQVSERPEPKRESLGLLDLAILLALKNGIGAKTTVGYSAFEVIEYKPVEAFQHGR